MSETQQVVVVARDAAIEALLKLFGHKELPTNQLVVLTAAVIVHAHAEASGTDIDSAVSDVAKVARQLTRGPTGETILQAR